MTEDLHKRLVQLAHQNNELRSVPNPDEATQTHIKKTEEEMLEIAEKIGESLRPAWARKED